MATLLMSEWHPAWLYVWVKYKLKLSRKELNIAHLIVRSLKAIVPLILIKCLLGYPIVKNMNGKSLRTSSRWTWQETMPFSVNLLYSKSEKLTKWKKKYPYFPLLGKKWLSALWPFFQLGVTKCPLPVWKCDKRQDIPMTLKHESPRWTRPSLYVDQSWGQRISILFRH